MRVLVAYASRHGATTGIAERIGAGLRTSGFSADVSPVNDVADLSGYDAFVIGSAAYMYHWLKEATLFAKRNRALLRERPVWLFSSGPLGTDLVDKDGNDIFEASRPKEFAELEPLIRPRGSKVFFGAWDPDAPPIGIGEKLLRRMPANKELMPSGDFRDWPAIDGWTAEIAAELQSVHETTKQG
ncbi:MAG TPA: flavodoxin domain-containing protein [Acidimicrobiia bacterium]